jgi:hypothetical protein
VTSECKPERLGRHGPKVAGRRVVGDLKPVAPSPVVPVAENMLGYVTHGVVTMGTGTARHRQLMPSGYGSVEGEFGVLTNSRRVDAGNVNPGGDRLA